MNMNYERLGKSLTKHKKLIQAGSGARKRVGDREVKYCITISIVRKLDKLIYVIFVKFNNKYLIADNPKLIIVIKLDINFPYYKY